MRISDPNKLVGKIMDIQNGPDMTHIIVDVGDQPVTATVMTAAAKEMNLKKGDEVFAMFNSTAVALIKDTK